MLVLSRRVGESIRIGNEIEVTVLRSTRSTIQVGIMAPPQVKILRDELLLRRQKSSNSPKVKTVEAIRV